MSKRPKNRSARDKQRARQRASQQARRQDYPLRRFQPPFEPYREWIRVPSAAGNMIAELAASAQEGVERDSAPITDDGASWHIHELHIHSYLIVDDDLIVNMAIPPTRPGGEWILNGHTTEWPGP